MSSSSRGQSMILGALFLLLLTLMVLVTLSVGQRTRERIEAQLAADAAAYSDAVVLARTLNEISLINRTRASLLVTFFGVESLISWSGHHRSNLAATDKALEAAKAPYAPCCGNPFCPLQACSCAEIGLLSQAQGEIHTEQAKVAAQWDTLDERAAKYVSDLMIGTLLLNDAIRGTLKNYHSKIDKQQLAAIIAATASPELTAPPRGDAKAIDESRDQPHCDSSGSLYCTDNNLDVLRYATMGSRGWHFTTNREGGEKLIRRKLEEVVHRINATASIDPAADTGGSGVGPDREAAQKKRVSSTENNYAEDHGSSVGGDLDLVWPSTTGCTPSAGTAKVKDSWVITNHLDIGGQEHRYEGSKEPSGRHNIQTHGSARTSWPWVFEYNFHELSRPANDFGQPKLYAVIERDFEQRKTPYPWDLSFQFHFKQAGEGAAFDLGGPDGVMSKRSGLRHQVAISSAIVYYHRPGDDREPGGGWREPPNLWNPYWRATLYAPDDDLAKYLDKAGFPEHADAIKRLLKAGLAGTL